VLNRNIAISNEQSGRHEQLFRLERFWEPIIPGPDGGFVFDPRTRYDRKDDRFILCVTQFQFGLSNDGSIIDRKAVEEAAKEGDERELTALSQPPRGSFLIAVSATSNPNGEWYVYRVPPEDAGGVDNIGLVDYLPLGFDRDAIYLTQNFFGAEFDAMLVTLVKATMYTGEKVTCNYFDGISDPNADRATFTVQPAQQPFSAGIDGTFYLVNSDFSIPFLGPIGTLTLWELTDPLGELSWMASHTMWTRYLYPLPVASPKLIRRSSLLSELG